MTSPYIMNDSFQGLHRSPVSLHMYDFSIEDEAIYLKSILFKSEVDGYNSQCSAKTETNDKENVVFVSDCYSHSYYNKVCQN